jgi:hypothetical protein
VQRFQLYFQSRATVGSNLPYAPNFKRPIPSHPHPHHHETTLPSPNCTAQRVCRSALRQSPGDGMCLNHLCYYAVWHSSHTARVTVAHACRQPYLLSRVGSYSDISSMHCVIPVVVIYRATAYHLYWNSHTANASYQSYRPNPDFAPFKKIAGSL